MQTNPTTVDIVSGDLAKLDNLFGSLKPELLTRLQRVIEKPSLRTWDNAYSIIVRGDGMLTLWQAVIAVDPTFPKVGKSTDQRGRVIEQWPRVPDRMLIRRALRYAAQQGSVPR